MYTFSKIKYVAVSYVCQRSDLNGSGDMFGLNHYGTGWAQDSDVAGDAMNYVSVTEGKGPLGPPFVRGEVGDFESSNNGFDSVLIAFQQSIWLYGSGWGFRKLLNWVAQRYKNPPIYVTESGWSLAANRFCFSLWL